MCFSELISVLIFDADILTWDMIYFLAKKSFSSDVSDRIIFVFVYSLTLTSFTLKLNEDKLNWINSDGE